MSIRTRKIFPGITLIFLLSVISLGSIYEQIFDWNSIHMDGDINRNYEVLEGKSIWYNPWQYRVLSPLVVNGLQSITPGWERYQPEKKVESADPYVNKFHEEVILPKHLPLLLVRYLQNMGVFLLVMWLCRRFGVKSMLLQLTGVMLLAFGMAHSSFDSDLAVNSYFDVLFYLLAGFFILKKQPWYTVPLMVLAALNRETSALIPLLVAAQAFLPEGQEKLFPLRLRRQQYLWAGIAGGIVWAAIFAALRWYWGWPEAGAVYGNAHWYDYLHFNLFNPFSLLQLFATFMVVPFIAFRYWNSLPKQLLYWALALVPLWVLMHFTGALVRETRLLMVPYALVFIPALMLSIREEVSGKNISA